MTHTGDLAHDPWQPLRRFTHARIGLGRRGDSLPTHALLQFQSDHAEARDAVHTPFDSAGLAAQLAALGHDVLHVASAAADRATYLQRPDLGRTLDDAARNRLCEHAHRSPTTYDAVFVIADGLSARAVHRHAAAVVERTTTALRMLGWRVGPVVLVTQGRVAIGDVIGAILHAEQVAVLIGERPGLSVADSLGVYLTYAPRPGRTDAERNCISNIHAHGLSYAAAAHTLVYVMTEARRLKLTGVDLKDHRQGEATAQVTD